MIDKKDVIAFFDHCAPTWEEEIVRNEAAIERILDNAGVKRGTTVLDVACGTGVLFPDYIKRSAASVTAVDISPEMVRIAREKCRGTQIQVICGDVEELRFEDTFDVVMVYNAFPHFPDPQRLIRTLAALTKEGGRLSVAHGMSRRKIDSHHRGAAAGVSNGLMHEEELTKLFAPYFEVDVAVSDEEMYQVCGVRRNLPKMIESDGGCCYNGSNASNEGRQAGCLSG